MLTNFDEVQKLGKDNVEATLRSFGAASKGFQAVAAEVTNYSKKSFEDGTAAVERLMGAKTLEKAIEVQSDYVKSAYEGLVAQATKSRARAKGFILQGAPSEQIVRFARARRVELIVMGTHGRKGIAKLFVGSVADRVVAAAACPVLTVRGK